MKNEHAAQRGASYGPRIWGPRIWLSILILGAVLTLTVTAQVAQAATLQVDHAVACDDVTGLPFCTITAALDAAVDGDIIDIAPGTYSVDTGETITLRIDKSVTLRGASAESVIVDATGSGFRVIFIPFGVEGVTIDGLTITGGVTKQDSPGGGIRAHSPLTILNSKIIDNRANNTEGGGIYTTNHLTIINSTVSRNQATDAFGSGGGIATATIDAIFLPRVFITDSTISDNIASRHGGGIFNAGSGRLTIVGSTVSGNFTISGRGGGIWADSPVTMINTSVSGNTSRGDGGGIFESHSRKEMLINNSTITGNLVLALNQGGGGLATPGFVRMKHTILAGNTAPSGNDCSTTFGNPPHPINSEGFNLIGDSSGCTGFIGTDITDVDVSTILAVDADGAPILADNGGPTLTHALAPKSLASASGDPAGCADANGNLLTTDQRGFPRPVTPALRCSIGSVEVVIDLCVDDPAKNAPGACGCGVPDTDADGDGVPDCFDVQADSCPEDPTKAEPGACGCGEPDTDADGNGVPDCFDAQLDGCPDDPSKSDPGVCGCGVPDTDTDGDGTADCVDTCSSDPAKADSGVCGCGVPDTDTDGDGVADCVDTCSADASKVDSGVCGCGVPDTDTDGDGAADCVDACSVDASKVDSGICGCGVPDADTDGDGTADCVDTCSSDPAKTDAGVCGCGVADVDTDGDGVANCVDTCSVDPAKIDSGSCGCGIADTDADGDGVADCNDFCPDDVAKVQVGACGCGVAETDANGNGLPDCLDALVVPDNFKCYAADEIPGSAPFAEREVTLTDRFGEKVTLVLRPASVCVPVDVDGERIQFPDPHLTCFQIREMRQAGGNPGGGMLPIERHDVLVENAFGEQELRLTKGETLCLPSMATDLVGGEIPGPGGRP